jgi:hypothetical protein
MAAEDLSRSFEQCFEHAQNSARPRFAWRVDNEGDWTLIAMVGMSHRMTSVHFHRYSTNSDCAGRARGKELYLLSMSGLLI